MYILGIETSCDETAASVIRANRSSDKLRVLSNVISSQISIHKKYGGVVPEIAAREHVLNILPVISEALEVAKIKPAQLEAIGVTKGPGLVTSLLTGLETARSLAYAWHKPLIEVNHIAGHIYANFINNKGSKISFPAIILTVSGGHTTLLHMDEKEKIKIIGDTRDDAAGEAFDKAAKMMEIGYPGGPQISIRAAKHKDYLLKKTKKSHITLPRPMLNSPDYDFSFSGLKTALLYQLKNDKTWKRKINEYCYEFQQAVLDVLIAKAVRAATRFDAKTLMLTGGVSANSELREQMAAAVSKNLKNTDFLVPNREYTTDNAAMIATAAFYLLKKGKIVNYKDIRVDAGLQLK